MTIDAWEIAARSFEPSPSDKWRLDPVGWAHERVGVEPWSRQREILEAVRDERRIAVHSCHDVGKTYTAALAAAWFIDVHPPGTAFVLSTAPTGPQVKALLWRELNRLHSRARLPGRMNLVEWYVGSELVAFGRKPSEHNEAGFQGVHARHVLVVMDEACGIPDSLWTAAETVTSNTGGKILAIGNPDSNEGEFARVCGPGSSWRVIHIGYDHTPNFTDEAVAEDVKDQLISREWVEDRKVAWGEDSALYQSKILGRFPDVDADPWRVMPLWLVNKCRWLDYPEAEPFEAGIDVGAGGDRTVIVERRGPRLGRVRSWQSGDPMRLVGDLTQLLRDWGCERVKIDVSGIGWGVYGRLRELSSRHNPTGETTHTTEVVPVNFASAASNKLKYLNKRAELYWVGRDKCRLGEWDLGGLDEDALAEITASKYEIIDSSGRIKVEPKDLVRKRLGKSPDVVDALLLAFYEGHGYGTEVTTSLSTWRSSQDLTSSRRAAGRATGNLLNRRMLE